MSAIDIEQRLREQGDIEERLRLPISESMFVRRSDMLRALFAERAEAADEIASLRSKMEEAEGALKAAREFIADEFNDDAYEEFGEWLPPEARAVHKQLCEAEATLASLREADHA